VILFQEAADLGFIEAHNYIGAAYLDGIGVPAKNETKAFEHFSIAAAENLSRQAMFNVGVLYYRGIGTNQSCELALRQFREVEGKIWLSPIYIYSYIVI
jgi:TPR repeat protein